MKGAGAQSQHKNTVSSHIHKQHLAVISENLQNTYRLDTADRDMSTASKQEYKVYVVTEYSTGQYSTV